MSFLKSVGNLFYDAIALATTILFCNMWVAKEEWETSPPLHFGNPYTHSKGVIWQDFCLFSYFTVLLFIFLVIVSFSFHYCPYTRVFCGLCLSLVYNVLFLSVSSLCLRLCFWCCLLPILFILCLPSCCYSIIPLFILPKFSPVHILVCDPPLVVVSTLFRWYWHFRVSRYLLLLAFFSLIYHVRTLLLLPVSLRSIICSTTS